MMLYVVCTMWYNEGEGDDEMETVNLNVRVDKDVKCTAEAIANALGMNLSTAVNIFLRQMVSHNGLPFDVRLAPNAETRQALDDARNGRNLVGPFRDTASLMEALNSDA